MMLCSDRKSTKGRLPWTSCTSTDCRLADAALDHLCVHVLRELVEYQLLWDADVLLWAYSAWIVGMFRAFRRGPLEARSLPLREGCLEGVRDVPLPLLGVPPSDRARGVLARDELVHELGDLAKIILPDLINERRLVARREA